MNKTEELQAHLESVVKNCPGLKDAKVEYLQGAGFAVRRGTKTLAYLVNAKRCYAWINECAMTGWVVSAGVPNG